MSIEQCIRVALTNPVLHLWGDVKPFAPPYARGREFLVNSFFYIIKVLRLSVLNSKNVITARFYGGIGGHVLREPISDAALRTFANFD